MRIAIISDVHGNLPALETVLKDIENNSIDTLVSLGDNIGYGPWANETMDLIWEKTNIRVPGNHEEITQSIIEFYDNLPLSKRLCNLLFNNIKPKQSKYMKTTLETCIYTAKALNKENKQRLKELLNSEYAKYHSNKSNNGSFSFSHANPYKPKEMGYIWQGDDADKFCIENFDVTTKINFSGHTHIPEVYTLSKQGVKQRFKGNKTTNFFLRYCQKVMVIVPSVGQPRDRNPQTGYAIFDTEQQSVGIKRMDYDIDLVFKEIKKIKEYKTLIFFGNRLFYGQ